MRSSHHREHLLLLLIHFLLLALQCGSRDHSSSSVAAADVLSLTKGGGIRLGACDFTHDLFHSPITSDWSCEDATTYTWRHDFEGLLGSLSSTQREKLTASAGYCPHRRCQLDNVSAGDDSGLCPPGRVWL